MLLINLKDSTIVMINTLAWNCQDQAKEEESCTLPKLLPKDRFPAETDSWCSTVTDHSAMMKLRSWLNNKNCFHAVSTATLT